MSFWTFNQKMTVKGQSHPLLSLGNALLWPLRHAAGKDAEISYDLNMLYSFKVTPKPPKKWSFVGRAFAGVLAIVTTPIGWLVKGAAYAGSKTYRNLDTIASEYNPAKDRVNQTPAWNTANAAMETITRTLSRANKITAESESLLAKVQLLKQEEHLRDLTGDVEKINQVLGRSFSSAQPEISDAEIDAELESLLVDEDQPQNNSRKNCR